MDERPCTGFRSHAIEPGWPCIDNYTEENTMKRNLLLIDAIALIAMMATTLHAQTSTYTISGTITWKGGGHNGDPVVGASVKIGPGNYSTTTDAGGHYSISGVGSGPHTIHVKATKPNGSVTKTIEV